MSTAAALKPRLMTAEEFYEWASRPENENRNLELVRGEVIELPPPSNPHGLVCANATRLLGTFCFARGKGYVLCNDSGVILERDPDTVRGPDVAVYEDAESYEELPQGYAEVPPRLAVEVLSPNDRADQVNRKITDYLNNGVELVWVVDPEVQTVTIYRPEKGPRVVEKTGKLTGEDVLPGLRCKVADLFAMPQRPVPRKNGSKPKNKRPRR